MYWKVGIDEDENGTWITYNYFEIVDKNPTLRPYYNGILKKLIFPETKYLIIKAVNAQSEEEFVAWYNKYKHL